ncbi:MAG TPA: flagellar basal body-associated FliL family protein [Gammaproteobacteria bacterium]|nr:flagellar basal body-associated FliL family protein [Gammaproteobacteria bacterium]
MKGIPAIQLISRAAVLLAVTLVASPVTGADDEQPPVEIGYYALTPSIVSNLSGGPKYIRCDVQLMTQHAQTLPQIELHAAALRHAILMLIAGEDGNQLRSREGKEALRTRALESVQGQLKELTGETLVSDLFFTNYYVK